MEIAFPDAWEGVDVGSLSLHAALLVLDHLALLYLEEELELYTMQVLANFLPIQETLFVLATFFSVGVDGVLVLVELV
jgi:hypothetical protein